MAAETEAVGQDYVRLLFARRVGHVIQITTFVGIVVIYRRRDHALLEEAFEHLDASAPGSDPS